MSDLYASTWHQWWGLGLAHKNTYCWFCCLVKQECSHAPRLSLHLSSILNINSSDWEKEHFGRKLYFLTKSNGYGVALSLHQCHKRQCWRLAVISLQHCLDFVDLGEVARTQPFCVLSHNREPVLCAFFRKHRIKNTFDDFKHSWA